VAQIIQTVAKYDPRAKSLTLMRADVGKDCNRTNEACGATSSFSLYTAVTIREFEGGEKPSAYPKCGGGCIALVVVAVTVCVVLSGFMVLKKIVYDKRPDVKQRQFEMTVNT